MKPIIVIGAGAAGLAAARTLTQAGQAVVILEARDRIGGRVFTVKDERFAGPAELGAEFIHGMPPEIFDSVTKTHLIPVEIGEEHLSIYDGKASNRDPAEGNIWEELERISPDPKSDLSFREFVDSHEFPSQAKRLATAFVEGFNAADASIISTQSLLVAQRAEEEISGDRTFRLTQGYSSLMDELVKQCDGALLDLRLNSKVQQISWQNHNVTCTTADGNSVESTAAIITLPLPMLKNNSPSFDPPLKSKAECLDKLVMGQVQRVVFSFKQPFWEGLKLGDQELTHMSFIHSDKTPFPTWWSQFPLREPMLVGWNSGRNIIASDDVEDWAQSALAQLAQILGLPKSQLDELLVGYRAHNWHTDPHSLGAYSYCAKGGVDAPRQLGEPLDGTLFFAGEATDYEGHIGTVHGAMATGMRAAGQCLQMCQKD